MKQGNCEECGKPCDKDPICGWMCDDCIAEQVPDSFWDEINDWSTEE